MDATKPVLTPLGAKGNNSINFIEYLTVKQENKEYKLEFGLNDLDKDELIFKITPIDSTKLFYFQNKTNLKQLHDLSKIFSFYENTKEIISFLKTLKYEIYENIDDLELKFNVFLPNGQSKLIQLYLKKYNLDNKNIINLLLEENKKLKKDVSDYKNEMSFLKENIAMLLNENKKLWNEINKIKKFIQNNNTIGNIITSFDSNIINSINEINFILNYIKDNDKSFSFNSLNLLYRASRDGDNTETCHKLCDDKKNILIIIKSDNQYIFGGYCKIGFKVNPNKEYKIDNNCFLFSYNLKKIYSVIKDRKVICHIESTMGLCFYGSLVFCNNFMKKSNSVNGGVTCFEGFHQYYEMNGGKSSFKVKELEVFQLE